VHCPVNCISCNDSVEDALHVLFQCPFAVQVWRLDDLWNEISAFIQSHSNVEDIIFLLFHNLHISLQQRVATILWSIWKHRNLKLWQNEQQLSVHVVERAKNIMEGWLAAHTPPTDTKPHHGLAIGNPTCH
jgi:hypothetical protein